MAKEYIEREALMNQLMKKKADVANKRYTEGFNDALLRIRSMVHSAKAADVVEVRHGRWIEREDFNFDTYYDCSACGESFCLIEGEPDDNFYRYCPNCGARMDGE